MIELTKCTDKCFAESLGQCRVLSQTKADGCNYKCPFYKPVGCKEWVRIATDNGVWLLTPEEYEDITAPSQKGV